MKFENSQYFEYEGRTCLSIKFNETTRISLFKENIVIFFMDPAGTPSNERTVFMYLLASAGEDSVEKEFINLILPFSSVHLFQPLCSRSSPLPSDP